MSSEQNIARSRAMMGNRNAAGSARPDQRILRRSFHRTIADALAEKVPPAHRDCHRCGGRAIAYLPLLDRALCARCVVSLQRRVELGDANAQRVVV